MERGGLTEFDLPILNDEVRCTWLVVDFRRLAKQLQELLRIDQGLVDRAVNVAEHIQGSVQLI